MIDPNAEIQNLRQRLRFKNLSEPIIDEICDEVSREISAITSNILANAMSEAVNAGEQIGADDFINEIRAVRVGSTFDISTDSGKTDFSEPPFPMLPSLLKNAKTAKDGCVLNPRNKVLTTEGWKKIKSIVAGDMVLTHSGKFREVKKLLVMKTPIGTRYVNFYVKFDTTTNLLEPLTCNEISSPSISLTEDHLVLTPQGWVEAGTLKKGDLVAAPADLTRKCLTCSEPLPINTFKKEFCLNNKCARIYAHREHKTGLSKMSKLDRTASCQKGGLKNKENGNFDLDNWGCRKPDNLHKMRLSSNEARKKWGNGTEPELFFEKELIKNNINHLREYPIKTKRTVNAGKGRTRQSTMFLDFYIPELKLAIEVDGAYWHSQPEQMERDKYKEEALIEAGITLWRIPAKDVYITYQKYINDMLLWLKNHSGELGICWVPISKIKFGIVDKQAHIYANKYDICLEAEEHSFACQTIFIHNSLYKVIPIKQKGNNKPKNIGSSTEAAMQAIETARTRAKEDRGDTNRGISSPDAMKGMDTISAMQSISKSRQVAPRIKERSTEPAINFRVASSKQDASSKWVNPGKKKDMTSTLANINANLHDSIDKAIDEVIRKHEGSY